MISPLLLLPSFSNYQLTACLVYFVDPVQPFPGLPGIPSDSVSAGVMRKFWKQSQVSDRGYSLSLSGEALGRAMEGPCLR